MDTLLGLLILSPFLCMYFLPSLCALCRGHRNLESIFIWNLCLGWTCLVWCVCLTWAWRDNGAF